MKLLRIFIVISLLVASCNVINKDEDIPAFIKIDSVILNPGDNGSAQNNITDVRVAVNGQSIGIFEIPTIIPVLAKGDVALNIIAGIKNNGMDNDRIAYPLTKHYNATINLIPEETITIEPVFTYFDEIELDAFGSENFSGPDVFIATKGELGTIEDPTMDSSPLTDHFVGSLLPDFDEDVVEITSFDALTTSPIGPTMIEFNYKANQNFVVGLKSNTPGDPELKSILIGLNTSEDENGILQWKKIYVDLKEHMELFNAQGRNQYRLYFASETELDNPIIYLDNIKAFNIPQ